VEEVVSVTSQADANQVVILPSTEVVYAITLTELEGGGYEGWVNMSIPDWGSMQALFSEDNYTYEIHRDDPGEPVSKEPNQACPDAGITDERIWFPHWGDAQVKFSSETEDVIWFMFFKQV
jgi:hypothetical protein